MCTYILFISVFFIIPIKIIDVWFKSLQVTAGWKHDTGATAFVTIKCIIGFFVCISQAAFCVGTNTTQPLLTSEHAINKTK
jgi:hypothetical protein